MTTKLRSTLQEMRHLKRCLSCSFNFKTAFTLAEVLITLGIIGVVAAITMPTIIANVRDKSLESAYKKAQSSLINGYKLLMGKESIIDVKNLELMKCSDKNCLSSYHKSTFNVVQDNTDGLSASNLPEKYLLENGSSEASFSWSNVPYLFRTADGMNYGVEIDDITISNSSGNSSYDCGYYDCGFTSSPNTAKETFSVYVDINGNKKPNTVCKDMYKFRISGTGQIANICSELSTDSNCFDNPSSCSQEECLALPQVNDCPDDRCGWNSQGHFVGIYCDPNYHTRKMDWCECAKNSSCQNADASDISIYCR